MSNAASAIVTLMLPIKDILVPKRTNEDTNAPTESVQQLASVMREQGMLQPIGVRDDPEQPGKKQILWGRTRLRAAKSLKWEEIECRDYGTISDADAEFHTLSENLQRKELPRHVRIPLYRRFAEGWLARFPEVGKGKAASQARSRAAAEKRGEPLPPLEPEAEKPLPVVQALMDATGLTKDVVKADLRLAKDFSDEQITELARMQVTNEEMINICVATKNNPQARKEVVNLTLSQMLSPAEAIKEVVGDAPAPATETPSKEDKAPSAEEWVEVVCKDVIARLTFKDAFRREALYYRLTQDARMAYRKAIRKRLLAIKPVGLGPCSRSAYRDTFQAHPQHWLVCGTCSGTGVLVAPEAKQCEACRGNAFTIPVEQLK